MSLLLDTCTFLFLISDYEHIPSRTLARLENAEVAISTLCLWEMLIKQGKGRLRVETDGTTLADFWRTQCQALELTILSIGINDVAHLERLPDLHRDPFDRLLICQAIERGLTIVTPDEQIHRYPIKTLWN